MKVSALSIWLTSYVGLYLPDSALPLAIILIISAKVEKRARLPYLMSCQERRQQLLSSLGLMPRSSYKSNWDVS
jgi:hypothetical protein